MADNPLCNYKRRPQPCQNFTGERITLIEANGRSRVQCSRPPILQGHVATLYGRKDILEYIVGASKLPIDCRDGYAGTALHLAALNGSDDCVKLLLSKGADAKIQDKCGDNALHFATDSKALSVIEMLIKARTPLVAN